MEGEPEAYRDEDLRSVGISPRERLRRIEEMLAKMDEKLDAKFEALDRRITDIEVNGSKQAREAELAADVLEKRLWAVEVNIAPIATTVVEKIKTLENEHDSLTRQVRAVERKMSWYAGGLAVLGVLVGMLTPYIIHVIERI